MHQFFARKALCVFILTALSTIAAAEAENNGPFHASWQAEPLLVEAEQTKLECGLETGTDVIDGKNHLTFGVRFDNRGEVTTNIFNPFAEKLLPVPFEIALFDQDHKFIGVVPLQARAGSRRTIKPRDWLQLSPPFRLIYKDNLGLLGVRARASIR